MSKAPMVDNKSARLRYTSAQHSEYLKTHDFIRLRWKHLFDGKNQYNTNMFRNFVLNMWKSGKTSLSDACLLLPELKSANTQREYIYKFYDNLIIESNVYVGTDKIRRDQESSYGRGKSSPIIWLKEEIRAKVDEYLDEAVCEIARMAESLASHLEEGRRSVRSR